MSDLRETGAIDWFLIEAPGKTINGELVGPLLDLVNKRLIRIIDALILVKRNEGDFDALVTNDLDPQQVGDLGGLAGVSSGLLSDEDAADAAAVMQPNSLGLTGQTSSSPGQRCERVHHVGRSVALIDLVAHQLATGFRIDAYR